MPLENTYKLFIRLQIGEYVYISIRKRLYAHTCMHILYIFLFIVLGEGTPDGDCIYRVGRKQVYSCVHMDTVYSCTIVY